MKLISLEISNKADLEFTERIYIESFPPTERRAVSAFHDIIEHEQDFTTLLIINDKSERVGFLTFWMFKTFIFAEHFAISSEFRNSGYGAKAILAFINYVTKPIILEVETPSTEIAKRRIEFYKRLGFKGWDIEYAQPSYMRDSEPIPMILMSYGNFDLKQNFDLAKKQIYKKVYSLD